MSFLLVFAAAVSLSVTLSSYLSIMLQAGEGGAVEVCK
jgi:hypothetical protein